MKKVRWLSIVISIVFLLSIMVSSSTVAQEGNNIEANKALVMALIEADNTRDYDRMNDILADDVVRHSAATSSSMPETALVTNREQYKQFLQASAEAFPDYQSTVEIIVAEGDYVAYYSMFKGTFVANSNKVEAPILGFVRIEDEKIAEVWVEWENMSWGAQMQQGAPPPMIGTFELPTDVTAQDENVSEANKEVLLAWFEADTSRQYNQIRAFFTEDLIYHSAAASTVVLDVQPPTRRAYEQFWRGNVDMFPDYYVNPSMLVAEDDYVAFYGTFTGTFVENNNRINVPMLGFARFEDGKIVELWIEWDNLTWDTQKMAAPVETTETPITGIDDIIGTTRVYSENYGWAAFSTFTEEGISYPGMVRGCAPDNCFDRSQFEIEGNQIHFLTSETYPSCAEATYEAFVVSQNDVPVALRFELVGEDCYLERVEAMDGKTNYFVEK